MDDAGERLAKKLAQMGKHIGSLSGDQLTAKLVSLCDQIGAGAREAASVSQVILQRYLHRVTLAGDQENAVWAMKTSCTMTCIVDVIDNDWPGDDSLMIGVVMAKVNPISVSEALSAGIAADNDAEMFQFCEAYFVETSETPILREVLRRMEGRD